VSDARVQPARFLAALAAAARERFPAIGLGEDARISADTLAGGALIVDGKLIHVVAFPRAAGTPDREVGL
jgi:hypothetical protein